MKKIVSIKEFICIAKKSDKPEEKKPDNNSNIKIKVLWNLKNSKCEMIPEEDEDKQKTETKFYKVSNNNNNNTNKNNIYVNNLQKVKKNFRKIQIDTTNSQIKTDFSAINPLTISAATYTRLNQDKERKEISKILNGNSNNRENSNVKLKKPIKIERSIESPSTSEFTHDTTKKSNTTDENTIKERLNVFSARNISSRNTNQNVLFPPPTRRPMSNLNFGGDALWKKLDNFKEDPEIKKKLIDIMSNITDIKKTISQKKKQRSKLVSAPMMLNEFEYSKEKNNQRILKLKIDGGFQTTKNEKKLQIDLGGHLFKKKVMIESEWNKITNNYEGRFRKKNDPVKIVKKL